MSGVINIPVGNREIWDELYFGPVFCSIFPIILRRNEYLCTAAFVSTIHLIITVQRNNLRNTQKINNNDTKQILITLKISSMVFLVLAFLNLNIFVWA